jgi:hypothetical protein
VTSGSGISFQVVVYESQSLKTKPLFLALQQEWDDYPIVAFYDFSDA